MWPFNKDVEPVQDFDSEVDERLLKVERRIKELELENGILRNKVLRKIQTRYEQEEPKPRRRKRRLYGGRNRLDDYEEEDDYDGED